MMEMMEAVSPACHSIGAAPDSASMTHSQQGHSAAQRQSHINCVEKILIMRS